MFFLHLSINAWKSSFFPGIVRRFFLEAMFWLALCRHRATGASERPQGRSWCTSLVPCIYFGGVGDWGVGGGDSPGQYKQGAIRLVAGPSRRLRVRRHVAPPVSFRVSGVCLGWLDFLRCCGHPLGFLSLPALFFFFRVMSCIVPFVLFGALWRPRSCHRGLPSISRPLPSLSLVSRFVNLILYLSLLCLRWRSPRRRTSLRLSTLPFRRSARRRTSRRVRIYSSCLASLL